MKARMMSRKFLVSVGVFAVALVSAVTGVDLAGHELTDSIITGIGILAPVVWTIVEGFVDGQGVKATVTTEAAGLKVALIAYQQENAELAQKVAELSRAVTPPN